VATTHAVNLSQALRSFFLPRLTHIVLRVVKLGAEKLHKRVGLAVALNGSHAGRSNPDAYLVAPYFYAGPGYFNALPKVAAARLLNFEDVQIGFWGGATLLVDPYTEMLSSTVRIYVERFMDIAILRQKSFVIADDVTI